MWFAICGFLSNLWKPNRNCRCVCNKKETIPHFPKPKAKQTAQTWNPLIFFCYTVGEFVRESIANLTRNHQMWLNASNACMPFLHAQLLKVYIYEIFLSFNYYFHVLCILMSECTYMLQISYYGRFMAPTGVAEFFSNLILTVVSAFLASISQFMVIHMNISFFFFQEQCSCI